MQRRYTKLSLIIILTLIIFNLPTQSKQLTLISPTNLEKFNKIQKQIHDLQMMYTIAQAKTINKKQNKEILVQQKNNSLQQYNIKNGKECQQNITADVSQDHNENLKEYIKQLHYQQLDFGPQLQKNCQITLKQSFSHFLFQTPRSSYVVVSNPVQNSIKFYITPLCSQISSFQSHQVIQLYCDRGLCDDGNVVLLTKQYKILICSQNRNFTDCRIIAEMNTLIKGHIVGGIVRNKINNGIGMQIYIADSVGDIIVIDGQGKHRLSVTMQTDSQIKHFMDIHPYPIVISSKNWIYIFENNKYVISLTQCMYLYQQIQSVFVGHPYQTSIYIISNNVITRMQLKNGNKGCQYGDRFYYGVLQLQGLGLKGQQGKSGLTMSGIAQYRNKLYIGQYVINLKQKSIKKFDQCGNATQFNFQLMKNNYRKGICILKCSTIPPSTQTTSASTSTSTSTSSHLSLIVLKQKSSQQTSQKNNTIIIIITLLLVMLLIFIFLRSTTPNLDYDEQLKYDSNRLYKRQVQNLITKNKNKTQTQTQRLTKTKEKERNQSEQD